jgi:hypothetical protein
MSQLRADITTWLSQEFRIGRSTAVAPKTPEGDSPP